ncbi:terpene synthase 10-like [Impatiens glandulifera]|uniref:terpene synthase 10-like n=1 Tax=Impatiens glandulifera TaxID=253017 RepID=UPI001FB1031F|nr:terpene synthase 10-like [Impatiens glandulifera]
MASCLLSLVQTHARPYRHPPPRLSSRRRQQLRTSGNSFFNRVRCEASGVDKRRSADYGPPVWKYEFLQSLTSIYVGDIYEKKAASLKGEVIMILEKMEDSLQQLEVIDIVQRLGISYHLEAMIESMMTDIYNHTDWIGETDLHGVALRFRLFRQLGYNASQDVFNKFKDENGHFKKSLCNDTKGLLSMYEASFHSLEGESALDEAMHFSTKHLKENLKTISDPYLAKLVSHALELPLHWTMHRFEARWFIDAYGERKDFNNTLLNFAKLDFNMVQAIHQEELKHVSSITRWWEDLGWNKKLPFTRDRLVESYLWTMGELYRPENDCTEYGRLSMRVNQLVTSIDDVYDVYGTLDELELFTEAIKRSDLNLLEQMSEYLKICFLGNFNSVNYLAYKTLQNCGVDAIPYLKIAWADLCGRYLNEAKWFHSGYVPTLEEYLNNGWITITIPMLSAHRYFLTSNNQTRPITKAGLDAIINYHDLIKWPSMVVRLANDLQTSKAIYNEMNRGDTMKSMQVYMREGGISMEEARQHVKELIRDAWKKINSARVAPDCPFSKIFVEVTINHARVAQYIYQYGDGIGHEIGGDYKDRMALLLFEPIPLSFN